MISFTKIELQQIKQLSKVDIIPANAAAVINPITPAGKIRESNTGIAEAVSGTEPSVGNGTEGLNLK